MFCSILFSSDWQIGLLLSKPFFPLLAFNSHICNLILNTSLIVPLLFSLIYCFLSHFSFSTIRHFFLPAISSIILFYLWNPFLLHSFFPCCFVAFLCIFSWLQIFQSPGFQLYVLLFCKNHCCNSFSLVSVIFLIFLSSLMFFILWYNISGAYCILFSAGQVPVSIKISLYVVLTVGLNILYKAFPCILSISFIFFFFMYPHASMLYISAGIKQASKAIDWTLVSSFQTWYFDSLVLISLLIASHFCLNSTVCPFRFPSFIVIRKYLYLSVISMFTAFTYSDISFSFSLLVFTMVFFVLFILCLVFFFNSIFTYCLILFLFPLVLLLLKYHPFTLTFLFLFSHIYNRLFLHIYNWLFCTTYCGSKYRALFYYFCCLHAFCIRSCSIYNNFCSFVDFIYHFYIMFAVTYSCHLYQTIFQP